MSKLTESEKNELFDLIKKEWQNHPDWSFQDLIKQLTYVAVGHTDLMAEDEQVFLDTVRKGWKEL